MTTLTDMLRDSMNELIEALDENSGLHYDDQRRTDEIVEEAVDDFKSHYLPRLIGE